MSAQSAQAMLSTALRSLHLRKAQMVKRTQIAPGAKYGQLTIITEAEPHTSPCGKVSRRVECICECGSIVVVQLPNLRNGNTTSCGCARNKHGMSRSPTYKTWEDMIGRCLRPSSTHYARYGGRGITVCERWRSFSHFLEDMGEKPDGLTLERIDNDKGYFNDNCRWATRHEQARNRCDTRTLTCRGETMCLTDWAARLGIHPTALEARLKNGWTIESALTTPSLGRGYRRWA